MLSRVVARVVRHPRRVLVGVALLFVAGLALGAPVAGLMTSDTAAPHAADVVATHRMAAASGVDQTPDAVLLVRPGSPVRSPAGAATVASIARQLQGITGVATVAQPGPSGAGRELVSRDGRAALVVAGYRASVDPDPVSRRIIAAFGHRPDILVGGDQIATLEINDDVSADLTRAEVLVFPVLFVLGLWIFRGLVAALLPLLIGALTIVVALLGLRIVNSVDQLSTYVLNLMIGLGLGLSIDYSLFVISRLREEAVTVGYTHAALVRAVTRSGRTIIFSSLTVASAMAALLVFPQRFLYSMGVGGVIVTLAAMAFSLIALPAILALLGPRIDAVSSARWRRAGARQAADPTTSVWYRIAHLGLRRPVWTLLGVLVLVGVLCAPAARLHFSDVDATSLPSSAPAHQVGSLTAAEFPGGGQSQLQVVLSAPKSATGAATALTARLAALPGARSVAAATYLGKSTWMIVVTTADGPYTGSSRHLVQAIHALRTPAPILVAGDAAEFVDLEQSMLAHLPLALAIVGGLALALIFALTGSVVLAVKTLVYNVLNVAAVLGLLVWIFQDGHLEGLLDFRSIGTLDLTQPILVLVIAFGLSTDYGVFLLSRIKEAHDELGDGPEPIALGLARTGRIISSAALLLFVALGAFSISRIIFIKEIGVGVALSVLLDATLVRALLVPATMRLFGRANWWAPAPLLALHRRLHLDDSDGLGRAGRHFAPIGSEPVPIRSEPAPIGSEPAPIGSAPRPNPTPIATEPAPPEPTPIRSEPAPAPPELGPPQPVPPQPVPPQPVPPQPVPPQPVPPQPGPAALRRSHRRRRRQGAHFRSDAHRPARPTKESHDR